MSTFDYALVMESEGAQFYQQQAEKNKNNSLHKVYQLLAEVKNRHAELLKNRAQDILVEQLDDKLPGEVKKVFDNLDDLRKGLIDIPDQLEICRLALDMEQKSISLYEKMLKEVTKEHNKDLLRFLINQEQKHYDIFDELVSLLNRPAEWVESAEFGTREEY